MTPGKHRTVQIKERTAKSSSTAEIQSQRDASQQVFQKVAVSYNRAGWPVLVDKYRGQTREDGGKALWAKVDLKVPTRLE